MKYISEQYVEEFVQGVKAGLKKAGKYVTGPIRVINTLK